MLLALFKATVDQPELRFRLVAKFCEDDFGKLERLLEIRSSTVKKLKSVESELAEELKLMREDDLTKEELEQIHTEHYLKRLDFGLFSLQMIDQMLLFLWHDPLTIDVELFIEFYYDF
jgi:beta-catenin-like protein 1